MHRPKSVSLMCPFASEQELFGVCSIAPTIIAIEKGKLPIKMLSGLMSLWMKPILWTLSTAQTSSEM